MVWLQLGASREERGVVVVSGQVGVSFGRKTGMSFALPKRTRRLSVPLSGGGWLVRENLDRERNFYCRKCKCQVEHEEMVTGNRAGDFPKKHKFNFQCML